MKAKNFLALDVGEKRIGLAMADSQVRIAVPFGWVANDERVMEELAEIMLRHDISLVVVGYPRNQSGEPTQQTEFVVDFVRRLGQLDIDAEIAYQDESLTSVQAEQRRVLFCKIIWRCTDEENEDQKTAVMAHYRISNCCGSGRGAAWQCHLVQANASSGRRSSAAKN